MFLMHILIEKSYGVQFGLGLKISVNNIDGVWENW